MLPFYSPISPQSPVFSQNRAMGQCIKIKNMHDFVLFIHKIVHKLAGVAGFEPTNDGVRAARFQSFFNPYSPITPQIFS